MQQKENESYKIRYKFDYGKGNIINYSRHFGRCSEAVKNYNKYIYYIKIKKIDCKKSILEMYKIKDNQELLIDYKNIKSEG